MSGAGGLANLYGTEKDKVNCPFYFKMGACRNHDKCNRLHNRPVCSVTVLIPHMYLNPIAAPMVDANGKHLEYDKKYLRDHFEDFYEDTFEEIMKLGEIEEMNVLDNVCEHLLGNVYIKFATEEDAENALKNLTGRFYAGRQLLPEFVPVTDFREGSCRQYEERECTRGGLCNFMHLKCVSRSMLKDLFREQKKLYKSRRKAQKAKKRAEARQREEEQSGKRARVEGGESGEVMGMGQPRYDTQESRETSEERRARLRKRFEDKHGPQHWDD
eukprot:TRINITY_DN60465_c0_g1_i1.p1 TRINITY_DN60465_c0_g1~~TRINITY_DN60465_c0_g1_i1.p1  ORF type:complete len:272 (+),score=110.76 TRINITY_DN60465_c0_g1_i1:76-891(+)